MNKRDIGGDKGVGVSVGAPNPIFLVLARTIRRTGGVVHVHVKSMFINSCIMARPRFDHMTTSWDEATALTSAHAPSHDAHGATEKSTNN